MLALDTLVTIHGVPVCQELDAIHERYRHLEGRAHQITVTLKDFEGRPGVIGGVEILHGGCCPGRQDAVVFAELPPGLKVRADSPLIAGLR